ncbi:MAG TPA: SpoIIE family protein phosphatase [Rhodothermales bacterium]|nr:SpoIIE family protein phosphatase [Rhodothermales bacterium]
MSKYSILVVEDEHTLRRLLEYRLSKQYQVRTAANGEEALLQIDSKIPDLVVSDIMMPKMDGFALQATLQQQKNTRAIPFIFLTAKADEQSRLKGMRTGVDDYITKPFDIEQLLIRIERLLERKNIFQTQLDARIGHDFSQKLMPKKMPEVRGYRTFLHNSPREHGGGDLFDWTEALPGVFFLTIGDVMGKGLQAKFYAFSFLSYVRGTLHAMMRTSTSPAELMKRVNQVLMQDEVMEETFASLLLLRWEPSKNLITYANAGHCRPILATPGGADVISYSDIILGLDSEAEFRDTSFEIPPESALIAYTDGLMEQRLTSGELVGESGIIRLAEKCVGEPEPIACMLDEVRSIMDEDEFNDDILVFWLHRKQETP